MKKIIIVCLLAAFLAGCNLPLNNHVTIFDLPPQAWIDAPLDESSLPLAPYEVVFHCTDSNGVQSAEFSVNGQVQESLSNENPAEHLITFHKMWTPPDPGEYTLRVRTLNNAGIWSEYDEVNVQVIVPTPTSTLEPTATQTPTATPTPTATLTPTTAVWSFTNLTSPEQAYLGNCGQNQVVFQVEVNPANDSNTMFVFTRIKEVSGGKDSGWDDGTAMPYLGNGLYKWTANVNSLHSAATFSQAKLLYQFVLADSGGSPLSRSLVFDDVQLDTCGRIIIPLPIRIKTATPTPQIIK